MAAPPTKLGDFGKERLTDARAPSEPKLLEELWATQPCALFFLRRLGCSLCRSYIRTIEAIRPDIEALGALPIAISFEALGEGSDSDHSFEAGGFWTGPLYTIDKTVYEKLFGRKKLLDNFFGLLDMDAAAVKAAKETPGNFKGDGFQLGGQFVVAKGGEVLLDHRQRRYGDDAKPAEILAALARVGGAPNAS